MTKRPAYRNGYNKNELMQIIDKIDAGKSQMKNQTGKTNPNKGNNSTYFSCDVVKPDTYSG
jgi:hypothetical protein